MPSWCARLGAPVVGRRGRAGCGPPGPRGPPLVNPSVDPRNDFGGSINTGVPAGIVDGRALLAICGSCSSVSRSSRGGRGGRPVRSGRRVALGVGAGVGGGRPVRNVPHAAPPAPPGRPPPPADDWTMRRRRPRLGDGLDDHRLATQNAGSKLPRCSTPALRGTYDVSHSFAAILDACGSGGCPTANHATHVRRRRPLPAVRSIRTAASSSTSPLGPTSTSFAWAFGLRARRRGSASRLPDAPGFSVGALPALRPA